MLSSWRSTTSCGTVATQTPSTNIAPHLRHLNSYPIISIIRANKAPFQSPYTCKNTFTVYSMSSFFCQLCSRVGVRVVTKPLTQLGFLHYKTRKNAKSGFESYTQAFRHFDGLRAWCDVRIAILRIRMKV